MSYDHEHKFFIFQVKADFAPLQINTDEVIHTITPGEKILADLLAKNNMYERVEYATLGCNCGEVIRTRVKNGDKPT